ncbi:kelch protein, putative, partial [Plasmodium malariae]
KETEENSLGDITNNSSSNKHILIGGEEGNSNQHKKGKFESKDLSDGYFSHLDDYNESDDEYYSNVFVYFDENGNKKTIRIEKEEMEGQIEREGRKVKDNKKENENFNEDKEHIECMQNLTLKTSVVTKERYTVIDKMIDTHSVFVQFDDQKSSTENNKIEDLNENTSDFNRSNCKDDTKNLKEVLQVHNVNSDKNINNRDVEKDKDERINNLSITDLDSDKEDKKMKFIINDIEPIGRMNSHIFVINKNLYLFGGMYEYKNNEIILSDYWKINIFKREKWELVHKGNLDDIYVDASDTSSSLSIDDENKDDKEIEDLIICNKIKKIENKIKAESGGLNFDVNENLNEFFLRTKQFWLNELNIFNENKQNRKDAFILCEQKYIELKKYYNKIQKYKELLLEEQYEGSITEDDSTAQEESSNLLVD